MTFRLPIFIASAFLFVSCGGTVKFDSSEDGETDGTTDAPVDMSVDAPVDPWPDTPGDPSPDMPVDAPVDGPPDGPADAPHDMPADVGPGCGNGVPDFDEECDDGNGIDGDGCDNDCTWSCHGAADCDDGNPCTTNVCTLDVHMCDGFPTDCADDDPCTTDGCDPSVGCTHVGLPVWYRDEDGDGWGTADTFECANTPPDGYVGSAGDCCDINWDVNPDHTSWHSTAYWCGASRANLDYNCDGTEEQRWTGTGSCISGSDGSCTVSEGWLSAPAACGTMGDWISYCMFDGSTGTCHPTIVTPHAQECR